MLDDLKYIHEKDVQDALGIASKQPEQLLKDFDVSGWKGKKQHFDNIIYAGMGGSALAAILSVTWPGYTVPFEVSRQYAIPDYVSPKTLFIASSYSGNTEETLSALAAAEKKKAVIVVIAGGGKLQEIAEQKGYMFLQLPKAEQPRFAVFYNLKAVVQLLAKTGLFIDKKAEADLAAIVPALEKSITALLPTVPTAKNPAKKLALELMGKSVVIYAGPLLAPAAYKWKISCNENAKNVAWQGTLPEFNHNEFIGWSSHPTHKPYAVVDLRTSFDHPQIQKRFEISARLLSGMRPAVHSVQAEGKTLIEQLLWTVILGDFVTLYLGILNGLNPTPVELVEKLKKELV
ncbi:MAG: bifunctional phosphoglucose/phosphomannose isomerase [Candidatus Saccharibacteria bacterium]